MVAALIDFLSNSPLGRVLDRRIAADSKRDLSLSIEIRNELMRHSSVSLEFTRDMCKVLARYAHSSNDKVASAAKAAMMWCEAILNVQIRASSSTH